ncbi:MAG: 30S ribosomal protein S18 [Phototrophicales bacterium]|nr:MAG: 30S ribosomal protein S18 [Phototrophicales bacterium]
MDELDDEELEDLDDEELEDVEDEELDDEEEVTSSKPTSSRFSRRSGSVARGRRRKRGCPFKVDGKCVIDYKDVETLQMYITDTGKIRPRRQTGACSKCQRQLARAIKRARYLALLPYVPEHIRQK